MYGRRDRSTIMVTGVGIPFKTIFAQPVGFNFVIFNTVTFLAFYRDIVRPIIELL